MKGLKKTFILALCLLSCGCFYAQGAKVVNTIKDGKPLSFWTKWDPYEGYCPGPNNFVVDEDGNFYIFARTVQYKSGDCPLAWYKVSGKNVSEVIRSEGWNAEGFSYISNGKTILGIINSWDYQNNSYFMIIHAEMSDGIYDYKIAQEGYFDIQKSGSAYYTDGMLFICGYKSFLRLEFNERNKCTLYSDNDLFLDYYKDDYGIQMKNNSYRIAELKYYEYMVDKIFNSECINGSLSNRKSFIRSGYECLGNDEKGYVYYILKEKIPDDDFEAHVDYKCKVAIFDVWENKIYFYDFPLEYWNPPRTIEDYELMEDNWIKSVVTVGNFPWTLSSDGNIYFMDLDRKTNQYVIKKVDNLWEKDLKAKEKSIGTVTKNHVPLYKEASLDAENDGYNFENDFVWVKETKDNWSCIQKIDGREGWIPSEYVRY